MVTMTPMGPMTPGYHDTLPDGQLKVLATELMLLAGGDLL